MVISNEGAARGPLKMIQVQEGTDREEVIRFLKNRPEVLYVEPNFTTHIAALPAARVPNDFDFEALYAMTNRIAGGAKGDIRATEAWAYTVGSSNVIVAVIDTGIDYFHPDLVENIWKNPGEFGGNGLDDDGNGFVDDLYGYDFIAADSDPLDDHLHGTHVAGTIGARGNNRLGVTGVCWEVRLMGLKAFDREGDGSVAEAIQAINYAVRNGALIINASWGLEQGSKALHEAIEDATRQGVVFVAAAGNDRKAAEFYPAAYPEVIAVAATDARDQRARFSNYGSWVDIAAPGEAILSTLPNNQYGYENGTSMASPHIAGVAALLLARQPGLGVEEVRRILINSVDPVQADQPIGAGRINAARAVVLEAPLPVIEFNPPGKIAGHYLFRGSIYGDNLAYYKLSCKRGETNVLITEANQQITNGILGEFNSSLFPDGVYEFQVTATNLSGGMATITRRISIQNSAIEFPQSADILRTGGTIEIRGTLFGTFTNVQLAYAEGLKRGAWKRQGITLLATNDVISGPIANWDTTSLAPNEFYSLKLTTISSEGKKQEFISQGIYLDSFLQPNWPQYFPSTAVFPIQDWRFITPGEFGAEKEWGLIILEPGIQDWPARLHRINPNGTIAWTATLTNTVNSGDVPTVGDITGDGHPEIVVDADGLIFAFNDKGDLLPGHWPIRPGGIGYGKAIADLDNDGTPEVVALSTDAVFLDKGEWRELLIINSAGKIQTRWRIPFCGIPETLVRQFPAVANLDTDAELEIVVPYRCDSIALFEWNLPRIPRWVLPTAGEIKCSPVIADLNGDKTNEIVMAIGSGGGIYVVTGNGKVWPNWPVLVGESFEVTPSIADVDGDGLLEIAIPAASYLHLIDSHGFEKSGWPVKIGSSLLFASSAMADLDGDGKSEVIQSTSGYLGLALSDGDKEQVAGVKIWRGTGERFLNQNRELLLPIESGGSLNHHKAATPIIGDFNRDGSLDILMTSILDRTFAAAGQTSEYKERNSIYFWSFPEFASSNRLAWPQFFGNAAHTGTALESEFPSGPPVIGSDDFLILKEDSPRSFDLLLNDQSGLGERPRIIAFTQPPHCAIVETDTNGIVLLKPETNYFGATEFFYTSKSGERTNTVKVRIMIKPVNDPPVAINKVVTMNQNTRIDLFYESFDVEGDEIRYVILDNPKNGDIFAYPNLADFHPQQGFHGTNYLIYKATDGKAESAPATITIHVIATNNPPKVSNTFVSTRPGKQVELRFNGTDRDNDPLSVELLSSVTNGVISTNDTLYFYFPFDGFVGEERVKFRMFDGIAHSSTGIVTIYVTEENSPPRAQDMFFITAPEVPVEIELGARDPEGDLVMYQVSNLPKFGTLSGEHPHIIYTPPLGFTGKDRFTFVASDHSLTGLPGTVTITVARSNSAPIALNQSFTGLTNQPLVFQLALSDQEMDPLTTAILKGPRHGSLMMTGSELTYFPDFGFGGRDEFSYKVWDGFTYSQDAFVEIQILPEIRQELPWIEIGTSVDSGIVLRVFGKTGEELKVEQSHDLYNWSTVTVEVLREGVLQLSLPATNRAPVFFRAVETDEER
ncbi:MAG: S8 family serine peptidase [Verrucomicrobiota bacterium]|nr:S8 family serine peptidase [Verrucomicrobiota bacterium]